MGDKVRKGQVLAVLENPEFIRIQQQYMEIHGQLGYLQEEYDRKKILQEEEITSKKNNPLLSRE